MNRKNLRTSATRGTAQLKRIVITLLVTLVWAGTMIALWQRERLAGYAGLQQIGISPEVLLVRWTDYEHWMWIQAGGRKIGATHLSILQVTGDSGVHPHGLHEVKGPGYVLSSRTRMHLELFGMQVPGDFAFRIRMNSGFELQTLHALIEIAGQRIRSQGFVDGPRLYYMLDKVAAGTHEPGLLGRDLLSLPGLSHSEPGRANGSGTAVQKLAGWTPLEQPILLKEALLPLITRANDLELGDQWKVMASNPLTQQVSESVQVTVEARERITLEGETHEALRLRETLGPIRVTSWYDPQGRILKSELGGELTMTRTDAASVFRFDPGFKSSLDYNHLDREQIRRNAIPKLSGTPLEELLPTLPSF